MAFIEPMHRNKPNITYLLGHRDITGDEEVDRAAKDALSKAQPENFEFPCTDVFMKIQPLSRLCGRKVGLRCG